MADIKTSPNPLILREDVLRTSIEQLFFAYRDFTGEADAVLEVRGMGRAHHRVIYFVGRNPGIMVSDLLLILNITKQSLSRVLSRLLSDGYIEAVQGAEDKRQRRLSLTEKGLEFERALTEIQMARFSRAYKKAGVDSVDGFLRVLSHLTDVESAATATAATTSSSAASSPPPPQKKIE